MEAIIKKRWLSAVIFLALLISSPCAAGAADWQPIAGRGPNDEVFIRFAKIDGDSALFCYDRESLLRIKPDIVRIWIKAWNFTATIREWNATATKGNPYLALPKEEELRSVKKEKPAETTEKLSWDTKVMLCEIKCEARMVRLANIMTYDSEGKVMGSESGSSFNWDHIIPETIWEKIWKTFCGQENPKLDIEPAPEATPLRAIPF